MKIQKKKETPSATCPAPITLSTDAAESIDRPISDEESDITKISDSSKKKSKKSTKKQQFQVFLFFIHAYPRLIYICPVAMFRQLKIEENVYEKSCKGFVPVAAIRGGV